MAQIIEDFSTIEEEVKEKREREALSEAFSEDDGETAVEETSSKTKTTRRRNERG